MPLLEKLSWKLQRTKRLIADGRYMDLLKSIGDNMPFFLNYGKLKDTAKYIYLRRKYRSFIADKVKLLQWGGGSNEDVIWWLWLQGEDNAPDICKACLASLRRWHPEKKIITLDKDNLSDYVTFPDYIISKYERGLITNAHYSDLIRIQLLAEHGGTWIDSTILCTGRRTEYVMHLPLFVFKWDSPIFAASSWFMVSYSHDKIITLTRDLLFEYWKSYDYVMHYFLIHMFLKMAANAYPEEWEKMPAMSNQPPFHMGDARYDDYSEDRMKYFESISDFHKLTYKFKDGIPPSQSSIFQHIIDTYLH